MKQRVLNHRQTITNRRVSQEHERNRQIQQRKVNKVERCVEFIHIRLVLPVFGTAVFLTVLFGALQLQGVIQWNPWTLMTPLWVFFGLLFIAIVSACCSWHFRSTEESLLSGMWVKLRGPIRQIMEKILNENRAAYASAIILFSLFLAFCLLVAAKSSSQLDWSWPVVFLPLWLSMTILACSPVIGWITRSKKEIHCFFMVFLWIPLLTQLVLVAIKLEKPQSISLPVVLIPVWTFLAIGSCALCIGFSASMARRSNVTEVMCACMLGLLFLGPLIAFFILLCKYRDTSMAPMWVFSPLLLWTGMILCLFCAVGLTTESRIPSLNNDGSVIARQRRTRLMS